MTSDKGRQTSLLQGVEPNDVAAMVTLQETDPETLAAMVTMVAAMTSQDDGDVSSLAVVIAPAMWVGRRDQSSPLVAVVAGAVRAARRRLAGAAAARREWEETYGDDGAVADALDSGDVLPMGRPWCPVPGAGLAIGASDVLATWSGMGADETARQWLADAADAWCDWADQSDRAGRPLALSGAVAWRAGWKSSDAGYRASRTATGAALETVAGVTREDVLAAMPDGERPGWSVPSGTSRVSMSGRRVSRTPEDWESVVVSRVEVDQNGYPARLGYGESVGVRETVRRLSDGERLRVDVPTTGAPESVYGERDRADRADDRERAMPEDWQTFGHRSPSSVPSGQAVTPGSPVKVGAVPVSPRKKSGSGATGPTVPATF